MYADPLLTSREEEEIIAGSYWLELNSGELEACKDSSQ